MICLLAKLFDLPNINFAFILKDHHISVRALNQRSMPSGSRMLKIENINIMLENCSKITKVKVKVIKVMVKNQRS